ncbi:hypothetical protein D3C75_578560 [compost metagenome]
MEVVELGENRNGFGGIVEVQFVVNDVLYVLDELLVSKCGHAATPMRFSLYNLLSHRSHEYSTVFVFDHVRDFRRN